VQHDKSQPKKRIVESGVKHHKTNQPLFLDDLDDVSLHIRRILAIAYSPQALNILYV
jgi:hypothetical protein